jgi:hypothetical protein
MNVKNSKLAVAAVLLLILMGLTTSAAFLTADPAVVQLIGQALNWVALVAAVVSGLAFASYVSTEHSPQLGGKTVPAMPTAPQAPARRSSVGVTATGFFLIALASAWFGLSFMATAGLAFVVAALAVLLGVVALRYSRTGKTPPQGARYVLIAGAFLGGLLPGIVLWFILSVILSDRYCQLTSSKCM